MTGELAVARARPDDLADLLATPVLVASAARQAAMVRAAVASGACLVARDGARPAGFATWLMWFFDKPFLLLLVVEPAYRRRGTGGTLLRAVEDAVHPHGELFVSTETINLPMRALLAKHGYAASGSIENVNAPGNPELVFYKRL